MTRRASIWVRLRSPRLAAVLIAVLGVFVLLSFVVPQRAVLSQEEYAAWRSANPFLASSSERLGFEAVFSSWAFVGTLAMLAVNLVLCTVNRMRRAPKYPPRVPPARPEEPVAVQQSVGEFPPDRALSRAAVNGWRLSQQDADTWVLWRGRVGRLGSLSLHLGLLLVMAGGIASSLTRFSGTMVMAEGQSLADVPGSYVEIRESPRLGSAFTGAELVMDSIDFTYEGDVVSDAVARMRFVGAEGAARSQEVRVNYPLYLEGKSYLLEKAGHAVAVKFTDPSGKVRVASFVNLGEAGSDGSSDVVALGEGASARLTLISDRRYEGKKDPRRFELSDPILYVDLEAPAKAERVALLPGTTRDIDGWTVEFAEARLWNRFMVRADSGRWISFASFALVIIGMALRWLDPDAFVAVRRVGSEWHISGRSRHGRTAITAQIERVQRSLARERPSEEER